MRQPPPKYPPFPYTTLFRSCSIVACDAACLAAAAARAAARTAGPRYASSSRSTLIEPRSSSPSSQPHSASTASGLRSEEHTSELQSRRELVCRLLLVKKNNQ